MMDVVALLRTILYTLAFLELAQLTHLYFYAYKESKSRIIKSLVIFLLTYTVVLAYRTIQNYTIQVQPDLHDVFEYISLITTVAIILSARNFKKESVKLDEKNLSSK